MHPARRMMAPALGVALLGLMGCHSHPYYPPQPMGAYPAYPSQPVILPQNGMAPYPGATMQGQPTPVYGELPEQWPGNPSVDLGNPTNPGVPGPVAQDPLNSPHHQTPGYTRPQYPTPNPVPNYEYNPIPNQPFPSNPPIQQQDPYGTAQPFNRDPGVSPPPRQQVPPLRDDVLAPPPSKAPAPTPPPMQRPATPPTQRPATPPQNPAPFEADPQPFGSEFEESSNPPPFQSKAPAPFPQDQLAVANPIDNAAFEQPAPFQAPNAPQQQVIIPLGGTHEPNPYDYDRNGYTWLRGVVDYDPQQGTWHIIYNIQPDPNDRFGGSLTLVHDDRLNLLKNDQVVLMEGTVDYSALDRRGKASYRMTNMAPLKPRAE